VGRRHLLVPQGVEIANIPNDQSIVIDIRYAPAADDARTDSFRAVAESDLAMQNLTRQGFLP
jgi:hypothetical protein